MDNSESVAELFDELCHRVAAGERIDRTWINQRYPQYANEMEELLPTLALLLEFGQSSANAVKPVKKPMPHIAGNVGDHLLIRELGRGGMGIVYQAEQLSVGRHVALKILPFAALLNQTQLERFNTEATAAARLQHSGIVAIYSVGCERGIHYYSMQLIEGPSLAEVIAAMRQEKTPVGEEADTVVARRADMLTRDEDGGHCHAVARIGKDAAEALHYAHENGVLHRDIKPSNLLLDNTGHVWIADFGLARVEDESQLTRTGDILGTLRYMSPEQATGERVDVRSDVYSLGATLYELATLQPVFDAEDRRDTIKQVLAGNPISPHKVDDRIPTPLSLVISKAMARLDERYQTARELADDLRRFLDGEAVTAKPPTRLRRARSWSRRHRLASTAIVSLLILVLLLPIFTHHFLGSPDGGDDMKISKTAKVVAAAAAVAIVASSVNAKKPPKPPPGDEVPNPSGLVVSAVTEDSITLDWISGGGTTAGFIVAYKEGTRYPKSNLRGATVIDVGDVESYTVPDLLTDQIYSFRVCAVDSSGKRSSEVTVQGTTVSGAVPVEYTLLGAAYDPDDRLPQWGRLIQQADGKLLSPGDVVGPTMPEGFASVLRWNADYTVDYEFGNDGDGAFDHDFGGPIGTDRAWDVVQQTDGKLVIVGTSDDYIDSWIARLEPDGSLDPFFGNNGKVDLLFPDVKGKLQAVVIHPDDSPDGFSLIALGHIIADQRVSIILVKFTSDGVLDSDFGSEGFSIINLVGLSIANRSQLYVAGDGGLLVAGAGPDFLSSAVYKIDPGTGTLDTAFGNNGLAEIFFDPDGSEAFLDLAIQEDGKIVAVGGACSTFNIDAIWNADLYDTRSIARFNQDGSIDGTFGDSGARLVDFGVRGGFRNVSLLSNNKFVAYGSGGLGMIPEDLYLARFNSTGSLDLTFNGTGSVSFNLVGISPGATGMIVVDDFTYLVGASGYDEEFGWTPCLGMVWHD